MENLTYEDFYKDKYKELKRQQRDWLNKLYDIKEDNLQYIMYVTTRLKSPDSLLEKLDRKNIDINNMYTKIKDIIGFRITCPFASDIPKVVEILRNDKDIHIVEEKDYMHNPKESGYQGYHIIIQLDDDLFAEIQIRTMVLDYWAVLEQKLHYKKEIKHEEFIAEELKRMAKILVAIDKDMDAIKELLSEDT